MATLVNGIINAVLTGGVDAGEIYIESLDPALFAIPVLGSLLKDGLDEILSAIQGQLYTNISQIADQITIDIQTNGESSAVATAAQQLATAKKAGNQDAVTSATQNLINSWASLIHSDGSADTSTPPPL